MFKAIDKFNSDNLEEINIIIKRKIEELNEELKGQIHFSTGGISYTNDSFTTSLKALLIPKGSESINVKKIEWDKYCHKFYLNKDDFGKGFEFKGEKFRICGIKQYAEKYPVIAKSLSTGKELLFTTKVTNNLLF